MSADNWAVCPKCANAAYEARSEALRAAEAAYGTVDLAEYKRRLAQVPPEPKVLEDHSSFREDWEIYNNDHGTLRIRYSGGCGHCGLHVNFEHDINLLESAEEDEEDTDPRDDMSPGSF